MYSLKDEKTRKQYSLSKGRLHRSPLKRGRKDIEWKTVLINLEKVIETIDVSLSKIKQLIVLYISTIERYRDQAFCFEHL